MSVKYEILKRFVKLLNMFCAERWSGSMYALA